ncbi:hypothetical protein VTJ83DRAFT_5153 [Remersonia thermophila]|uniref:Methyltransferase n=1 Tax=Remersonia thermophila TaxID=72144 RepID=A0ABR4DDI6_9PEZI
MADKVDTAPAVSAAAPAVSSAAPAVSPAAPAVDSPAPAASPADPASPAPLAAEPASGQDPSILPASHWEEIEDHGLHDGDSGFNETASSTASLSSSILHYRTIQGRTYASEIGQSEAWAPNDERHIESMDIHHHACTLMLKGKLYLAPIKDDVEKVLDIGTGTGIWAIDFADEHPNAQVLGTDVTPIQPRWVPPNVQFQIDDANLDWTWADNTFDYVHARSLLGNISDWRKFYQEAFRVTKPGGWMEHQEEDATWYSHNGGVTDETPMGQWGKVFREASSVFGRTFFPITDDIQRKCMEEAGFVDITVRDFKAPIGEWPEDPEEKETGAFFKLVLTSDLEGYVNFVWGNVMGWKPEEIKVYLAHLRRQMKDPKIHTYYPHRIVYGRKPE